MFGLYFDWLYILMVLLPGVVLSGWASMMVRSRFARYSRIPARSGMTGAQAAKVLLDRAGIHDVKIVRTRGALSDHYNPVNKTLALSEPVFDSPSIAAIGVATHEAGHAIQHATGYVPLYLRSAIVPAVQFGSPIGMWGMFGGLLLMSMGAGAFGQIVFIIGAIAFSLLLLFQLITLPVEFNASSRAKRLVVEAGIVSHTERDGIDKVLNAAAMTYVAAFVSSLLTLLYFLIRSGLLSNRD